MTEAHPQQDLIEKVNILTKTAKGSWLGLISYLAFAGVTLMGVRDEDFFLVEKETALPLIGVTIPTVLFFYVAPILGAALFAYFHLHLLKLWEALSDLIKSTDQRPISDDISPWLISDFALSHHPDALRQRPVMWLGWIVSLMLAFLATPIVLFFFWVRSMPAHELILTLGFCGTSLMLSIYLGVASWLRMNVLLRNAARKKHRRPILKAVFLVLVFTSIGSFSVFRTTIPAATIVDERAPNFLGLFAPNYQKTLDQAEHGNLPSITEPELLSFWQLAPFTLYTANLQGVDLSYKPDNWRSFDDAKIAFKDKFCKTRDVPSAVCQGILKPSNELPRVYQLQRTKYCGDKFGTDATCSEIFLQFAGEFEPAWQRNWTTQLTLLASRNLVGRDLRNANLRRAELDGAILTSSELQGADLRDAQLQGAILWHAQLQGADLSDAELQRANLSAAKLQGAILDDADLQGANLWNAELQGAHLWSADLQRANLSNARLQGARLWNAELKGADLRGAKLQGAGLSDTKLQGAQLQLADLREARLWDAELQGAILWHAQLQGADLSYAKLHGAILWNTEFDDETNLANATLRGAFVSFVDFTNLPQFTDHVMGMFGDSSVVLPGGDGPDSAAWPAHWPRFELEWNEAEEEWRKWLDDPEGYVPPEPPKELAEEAAG